MAKPSAAAVAQPRKAAIAGWIGSTLEYYDFFIYGTAAVLVFSKIFFPASDPAAGTLLALATFGVAYLVRPIGALVFGHIGDRFGRKRVLVSTVLLMGGSTFLVGCLPTYDHIGVLAPVLLVTMRLLQGLSAAGEQAGATSMSLEHAPANRRAFYTSFTLSGTQLGQILATAVFLPVAALPRDSLLSWGWRVPFWLSAVVVLIGFLIRRSLQETPVFEQSRQRDEVVRVPLASLIRDHSGSVVRVVAAATIATVSTIFTIYALSYAVNTQGLSSTAMLWVGIVASIVSLVAIPGFAVLSDRVGRKRVFIGGSLGCAVLMAAYLGSISTGNYGLIFLTGILTFGVAHSAAAGVWSAFYGELFPARVRLSGIAVGTAIGFGLAGFAPSIATALSGGSPTAWLPVAGFVAFVCLINIVAVATGRENFRTPTEQLGVRAAELQSASAPTSSAR
ncbi:MFS transporter [Amycolatopsis sp. CA-126428]|uniref:MFS transporter n=1 Tax=Amycolatopsis sp. CA-126428 TaxID=2073158 RepID=UPI000CD023D0|nr:MFS transporter [Amycolatopsis sp. CA-126428]